MYIIIGQTHQNTVKRKRPERGRTEGGYCYFLRIFDP